MSGNQESQEIRITPAPASSSAATGKSAAGKKIKPPKRVYSKTNVRLLVDHDHALRLASVQLERAGEEIYTYPQLVDMAMERFMGYLQAKWKVNLLGITPPPQSSK
jgi:hypothetical protein